MFLPGAVPFRSGHLDQKKEEAGFTPPGVLLSKEPGGATFPHLLPVRGRTEGFPLGTAARSVRVVP